MFLFRCLQDLHVLALFSSSLRLLGERLLEGVLPRSEICLLLTFYRPAEVLVEVVAPIVMAVVIPASTEMRPSPETNTQGHEVGQTEPSSSLKLENYH